MRYAIDCRTRTSSARRSAVAGLITLALVLSSSQRADAATVTASAMAGGTRVADSGSSTWRVFTPSPSNTISWSAGVNTADRTPFTHAPTPFLTEPKFSFSPTGVVGPTTYKGISFKDKGPLGSLAISTGTGNGAIVPGVLFGTNDECNWTIVADGSPKPATANSSWYSTTTADDPWCLKPVEFPPGETHVDLWIPVSLGSAHFKGHGRVELHVSVETTAGSRHLLDVILTPTGVNLTEGSGADLGFFMRDSLAQDPPAPGSVSMSAAALTAAFSSAIAGDSLTHPLPMALMVSGMAVPTSTLGDGSLIQIRVDTAASDFDGDSRFTLSSLTSAVRIPPQGTSGVMVGFDPMGAPGPAQPNTAACAYAQLADGSWMLEHVWDWTAGSGHALAPMSDGGGWMVAPCAGVFPTSGSTFYPPAPVVEIPDAFPTLPSFALGFAGEQGSVFNPNLGLGGGFPAPITIQPGLNLNSVPQSIGVNHWQYLPVQMNLQPDPARPWLYVGGNPTQPFVQPSFVQIAADGLFDGNGLHLPSLPLQIQFTQGLLHLNLNVPASDDGSGHVTIPQVALGQILAQPYTLTIGVAGAPAQGSLRGAGTSLAQGLPGSIRLVSVTVTLGAAAVAGVGDTQRPLAGFQLAAPQPNPFRARTQFAFSVPRDDQVRIAIYDMQGREVCALADARMTAGTHSLAWDGTDRAGRPAPGGMYFARVSSGTAAEIRKVTLIR